MVYPEWSVFETAPPASIASRTAAPAIAKSALVMVFIDKGDAVNALS
jgi:hypothetical protein